MKSAAVIWQHWKYEAKSCFVLEWLGWWINRAAGVPTPGDSMLFVTQATTPIFVTSGTFCPGLWNSLLHKVSHARVGLHWQQSSTSFFCLLMRGVEKEFTPRKRTSYRRLERHIAPSQFTLRTMATVWLNYKQAFDQLDCVCFHGNSRCTKVMLSTWFTPLYPSAWVFNGRIVE